MLSEAEVSIGENVQARRLPTRLMLEPTSRCNLRCPLCISGRREIPKKSDMTFESFRQIFDQFELGCQELTFHNFGEPLLNPELPKMIAHAKGGGCSNTCLSTNATLLSSFWCEELTTCGLDRIQVCVDGLTQETYSKYRLGGQLGQVVQGIRRLVGKARQSSSPLVIAMQFIVFRHNEHELDDVYNFAADLGVHQLDIKVSGSASRSPDFRPTDPVFVASNRSGKRQGPLCEWVFDTIVINCDGHVMPCCWAGHNPLYSMGDAFHHPIAEIWNSKRYRQLRENVGLRTNLWDLCKEKCLHGAQSRHLIVDLTEG